MSSRSFLALICVVLNPDPTTAEECTNEGSWRFSMHKSNLPLLGCADDPDWRRRWVATADCAWVGELPGSRCDDKDENGIKAEDACGCACGPTVAPSVEPIVYDCAWVGEDAAARCGSVSELNAEDACPKTCGDGTEDSETWYHKEEKKNCAWVGENPDKVEKRCDKMGEDPALAACALTCDAACALTAAPTTLGLDAFGDDEVLCEDDTAWSGKKGDCSWVAKNPDSRCSQAGYVVKGKDACQSTCDNGEEEDSATWYFKKDNKNCAWIGKQNANKIAKLCKKSGTDGNACLATCDECPDGDDDEDGDCVDDASWHVAGDEGKDCAWVSRTSNRCERTGDDGRVASEACPVSCDACRDDETSATPLPTATDPATEWEHIAPGCVGGHNMDPGVIAGLSVTGCKARCAATDGCLAIEYGVDYGGGSYRAGDCQLQDSADYTGCDGRGYNLDLYILPSDTNDSPTPSPTPCEDTANGASDLYGDDCAWYGISDANTEVCGNYDDGDFNAGEMCCVCGGGGGTCEDTANGASDYNGNHCAWYGSSDRRAELCGYYDDSDFNAGEMCCVCR